MSASNGSRLDYFQTERGKTIRVEQAEDGAVRASILKDGVWSEAPLGMIGLRLSKGSRSLTAAEIVALP